MTFEIIVGAGVISGGRIGPQKKRKRQRRSE
jgi:hypothetical protein